MNYFKDNYFIGTGLTSKTRYSGNTYYAAGTCGLSDYLVKFGSIGFLLLLFNLYKSFRLFDNIPGSKGYFIFVLAILTV